jgi:hypothetical protein
MICLPKFRITNPVIPMSALRKLDFSQGQLHVVSLSTTFLDPLTCFFPSRGEADLHKLSQDSPHAWKL